MSASDPPPAPAPPAPPAPPTFNIILSFLLVGLAWGFTTPFIRRAAKAHHQNRPSASVSAPEDEPTTTGGGGLGKKLKRQIGAALRAAADLLRNPAYAVPLLLNVTGSVWFFLLIGKAELSLTVPVVNTLAFLFTVIGEWWVEGKVISRETMSGMVLSVAGIALCVYSKNTA